MNNTLYLDAHNNKYFKVLYKGVVYRDEDISRDISNVFEKCDKISKIDKIIFLRGPGSFTSLRIGATFAIAFAAARNIQILGIRLFVLFEKAFPKHNIFFYTGTKKWIKRYKNTTKIIEKDSSEINEDKQWFSNAPERLEIKNNLLYPEVLLLMEKYHHLANTNLDLIYPVTVFD